MVRKLIRVVLRIITYPFMILAVALFGLVIICAHSYEWIFNDNFYDKWETKYREQEFYNYKIFAINILSLGVIKK